jgi:predicted DNA-binding transcriptional regulator YafY
VYAGRGPGGGCALLESYRTNLTGLTEEETLALFMLSIPGPLTDLGLNRQLKAALQKLAASLPGSRRGAGERARQRIHLDWQGWRQPQGPAPHLKTIHQAVWSDRQLRLTCRLLFDARAEYIVEPYGLVAKGNAWHLVASRDGRMRVYNVTNILQVEVLPGSFGRPAEFNLAAFWEAWCRQVEQERPHYPVHVRLAPDLLPYLVQILGEAVRTAATTTAEQDANGWQEMELDFSSLHEARTRLMGLGAAVEVLEPPALRYSIIDFANQIHTFYGVLPE